MKVFILYMKFSFLKNLGMNIINIIKGIKIRNKNKEIKFTK